MATRDQWGRNIGLDLHVSEMARQMNSPTTNQVETSSAPSTSNESWEKLYKAVNSMAVKADANASADLTRAESWANTLIDFYSVFKKSSKNDKKEEKTNDFNLGYLEKIAEATEALMHGSKSQQPMWVEISKISGEAQRDIANAIKMSGCCGISKKKLFKSNESFSSRSREFGVSQATQSALGGKGGIMRDVVDSSNFGGRNDGGGNGRSGGNNGNNNGGMSVGDGEDGGEGINPAKLASRWLALAAALQFVGGTIQKMHRGLVDSMDLDPISNVFGGALKNHNKFRESIRASIHEQQGFGAANRAIEESYIDIEAHVSASGSSRGEYQAHYLKNLDRGLGILSESEKRSVKGLKLDKQEAALIKMKTDRMQSVQTTALTTANMLHMSADATNDMFMKWHQHIGLSEASLGEMGRHMQNVARSTGVTGDEMASAMKNSEVVVKNLKAAGVANVDSIKNATQFMVAAQKHGFEDGAELMNALSSGVNLMDSKYALFLRASASFSPNKEQVSDLNYGTILREKDGLKNQAAGQRLLIKNLLSPFKKQLADVGIDYETMDTGNLSGQDGILSKLQGTKDGPGKKAALAAVMAVQRQLKTTYKIEPGESDQLIKTMEEKSMTSMDVINDLSAKLKLMKDDELTQTDEYSRLQLKLTEAQTSMSADAFSRMTGFSEKIAANGGVISEELRKEMSAGLSEVFGSEQGADAWLKDLSKNTELAISQVNDRAKASGYELNDLLNKRGVSGTAELSKLLQTGDVKGIRVLQESLQELSIAEKRGEDPFTDIRETLRSINNKVGTIADWFGFSMGDISANIIYYGGFTAGLLFDILSAFAFVKGAKQLINLAPLGAMLSKIGSVLYKVISTGLSAFGSMLSKTGSMLYRVISTGLIAFRNMLGRLGVFLGRFAPAIGKFIGKAFAPLAVVIGGVQGYMDAESHGRSKGEGVLLGALTGGVGTGSIISDMIGVEKGSTADKAIGVGTSAIWAASIGAAIGTFVFPGIGTAVGGIVGGVVGAGLEIVKILTEGTDVLNKYLIEPLTWVAKYLFSPIIAAYEILAGVLTGDMTRVLEGITGYFLRWPDLILKMIGRFGPVVLSAIAQIPSLIMSALVSVFVDLPKFLWNSITNGLTALASNEWVGPIFAPILDLWNTVGGVLGSIFGPIGEAFTGLGVWVDELTTSFTSWMRDLFGASEGFDLISESAKWLGSALKFAASLIGPAVKFIARVIGFLITCVLSPFKLLARGVGAVVNWIGGAIETLSGLIYGDIDFGAWFYDNTIGALSNFGAWLYDNTIQPMINFGAWLYDNTIQPMINFGAWLWDNTIGAMATFGTWLWDNTIGAMATFGAWLWDNTIGAMATFGAWLWDNTIGAMATFGAWLWDNTIGAMATFGAWLWDNTIGAMATFGAWLWDNTIGAMATFGAWLWDNTIGRLVNFGAWLWDNTTGRLIDLGVWLFNNVTGALVSFGTWMFTNITDALADLGTWIYNNIINGAEKARSVTTGEDLVNKNRVALDAVDLTNKNGIEASSKRIETAALDGSSKKTEALQTELNWAKLRYAASIKEVDYWKKQEKDNASWILPDSFDPGYKMSKETRQSRETEKIAWGGRVASLEQQIKMENDKPKIQPKMQIDSTKSSSIDISGSINKLKTETSTIKDPLNKLVQIEKEKSKFVIEMTKPKGSTIDSSNPLNKIKSEALTIPDPLNKFKEGTRSIVQDGVAVLHKGEMIIPSEVWNQIKATGSGPFGAGSDVIKEFAMEFAMEPTKNNAIVDSLKNNMSSMKKEQRTTVSMSLEGAFDGNQSTEAMSSEIESNIKSMPFDVSEVIGSVIGQTLTMALKHLIILSTAMTNISMYLKEMYSENPDQTKDSEKVVIESLKNSILSSSKNNSTTTSLEGAFSNGESRSAIESSMSLETLKLFATTSNPTIDSLSKSINETNRQSTGELKPSNLGLFDSNQSNEAHDSHTSKMIKTDLNNVISSAISTNQSNSRNDSKAKNIVVEVSRALDYERSASEIASETQANKFSNNVKEKNIVVEASRALDYERSASEIANETQASKFSNNVKEKNIVVEASRALDYERSASEIANETQASKFSNNPREKNIVVEASRALDYERSASEIANETQASKFSNNPREKNIVVEASRALDYERSASEIANETQASKFYDRNNSSSNVSTNLLDYREQIKGEVGTLGLSRSTLESVVGKEHYGSQPSGNSSVLPSMDSIAEYLVVTQARKLDQMIEHLSAIRGSLTSVNTGTKIIGSSVGGSSAHLTRSGIKNIARDITRGSWDLTYGDYSPGVVTKD